MFPFPAIFALQNSQVHICSLYSGNKASYIEASVDNRFSFGTALSISDVNPDDSYVQFRRKFDDSQFGGEDDIIEDMIIFKNFLNIFKQNVHVQ